MRPRELPAEDLQNPDAVLSDPFGFNEAAGVTRGRLGGGLYDLPTFLHASMRPRELPAEDRDPQDEQSVLCRASMRPRELPAEDGCVPSRPVGQVWCFNEAAGVTRGRLTALERELEIVSGASMRPRELPAEDSDRSGAPAPRRPLQ